MANNSEDAQDTPGATVEAFFLAIHFAGLIALAVVLGATMWSIP